MENIKKEYDRLAKKQKVASSKILSSLDSLISQAERCRASFAPPATIPMEIEGDSNNDVEMQDAVDPIQKQAERRILLMGLQQATSKTVAAITTERKEQNLAAAKFGKAIDKELNVDLQMASQTARSPLNKAILNKALSEELFCRGEFGIGDVFCKEADVPVDPQLKRNLMELQKITRAFEKKDVYPALNWAKANRENLKRIGSSLEFQIHKLQFTELMRSNKSKEALYYARQNFPQFARTNMNEIQKLMGSLVYAKRVQSPYNETLYQGDIWQEVCQLFRRDSYIMLSLPEHSPLLGCINAGAIAIPKLAKVAQIVKTKPTEFSVTGKELPVQMEGPEFQYHNIFVCPVSREQSTPQNPPVMLPCGHVICYSSMEKLSKGTRFKCPYCPSEQVPNQTRVLTF